MRVYHLSNSRSTRVLWALEEIGEPYDVTLMQGDDRRGDEHRQRHPLGRVPVIDDGEGFLFESGAICLQLADLHPNAQLNFPLGSHERGLAYQWVLFSIAELEGPGGDARRFKETDPDRAQAGAERFAAAAKAVQDALGGRDYLVGDRFSIADLMVGAVLIPSKNAGLTEGLTALDAYVDRLDARPARQRSLAVGA